MRYQKSVLLCVVFVVCLSALAHADLTWGVNGAGGAGILNMAGVNFFDALQVNQGEYRTVASSNLFFSNVTLANSPSVILTLGQTASSASIKSLSGGGAQGGFVQPDNQARTVTLS